MKEILLNKNIYPLEVVFSASYALMGKAYFLFDENEKGDILIKIEAKTEGNDIERELKEELLNYLVYKKQVENTKEIREAILRRALLLSFEDENRNKDL